MSFFVTINETSNKLIDNFYYFYQNSKAMRKLIYFLFIGILIATSSCRKDFETVPSSGKLEFSKDTIFLDTVFTTIGSSTYTLKVYNRSNKDIKIPKIQLGRTNSKYRIMVDGMTGVDTDNNGVGDGKVFNNVELLAKDSLFIFVETTPDIADVNPTDYLYTDEIQFDSGSNFQKVNLVTLVKDAVFLFPKKNNDGIIETYLLGLDDGNEEIRVTGFELNENSPINGDEFHFTNQKPYFIYGYAVIPDGKTLTIDAGARIYFHTNSGLIVQDNGSLEINGTASNNSQNLIENEVTFEGDRLEPEFEDTPGQWGSIWLRKGSNANINHLTIKNAVVGILIQNSTLSISNSQIYNSSNFGISAKNSTIEAKNLVINSSGQASLSCTLGGDYQFTHSTFNNNWNNPKQRAVILSNYEKKLDESIITADLVKANFLNCIIYGTNNIELSLEKDESVVFNTLFENCLIKFNDFSTTIEKNLLYDFIRKEESGNIKNKDPKFYQANQNRLNIDETSAAFQKGNATYRIPQDILGITRSLSPDIGAYQSAEFPE